MRDKYQDYRDYDKEAKNLIKDLSTGEIYRLLEIVVDQKKGRCSDKRRKELDAVENAICGLDKLDKFRINRIINGYRSEMAQSARAKDGQTRPNKRKV